MFVRALSFASRKHSTQRRKDAEASPCINHPIALVSRGRGWDSRYGYSEATAAELTQAFGDAVPGIVIEVTDDKSLATEERKRLQIEHAPRLSPSARLVKVADKIANLRDVADYPPADWSIQRRHEYFHWAKQVVDAVPDVPPTLRKLFDDAYARGPTIGELCLAAGFKEDEQLGIGITIVGVGPPTPSKSGP